jgi:hypothetical protein
MGIRGSNSESNVFVMQNRVVRYIMIHQSIHHVSKFRRVLLFKIYLTALIWHVDSLQIFYTTCT